MWSGPRTVSTALMRSWGSRPDTVVVDEPLYAFYLARTGLEHPGRETILISQPNDWRTVLNDLTNAALPACRTVSYQKHMTHHLLPEVDRRALAPLRHAHLIRDPRELLASYAKVRSAPEFDDLGLRQQVEIFDALGGPVIEARDLLERPEGVLRALCAALDVPFEAAMLSWAAGPRDTDGVWAPHWSTVSGGQLVSVRTGRPPGRCQRTWCHSRSAACRTTNGCTRTGSPAGPDHPLSS